jgi:hypothetical protein
MKSSTPGLEGDDHAARASISYRDIRKDFRVTYSTIEDNFRDDLGFLPRTGVRIYTGSAGWRWRPWPNSYFREFRPNVNLDYLSDQENSILDRRSRAAFRVQTSGGGSIEGGTTWNFERLEEDFLVGGQVNVPSGDYNTQEWFVFYRGDPEKRLAPGMSVGWRDYYDGTRFLLSPSLNFRYNEHFRGSVSWSRNRIELPGGEFSTHLARARLDISFNTSHFLSTIFQYNNLAKTILSTIRIQQPGQDHPVNDSL